MYTLLMYEIKRMVINEVFRHLKRKLFNTYTNYLLHSFLLLMEFYMPSLYRLCQHCEYIMYLFLLSQFFVSSKLKTSLQIIIYFFSTFAINIRMYFTCANKENNFKASML